MTEPVKLSLVRYAKAQTALDVTAHDAFETIKQHLDNNELKMTKLCLVYESQDGKLGYRFAGCDDIQALGMIEWLKKQK